MTTPKRKSQHKPASASKRAPATPRKEKPAAALAAIALGEDSTRQFKRDVTNGDALAAEMVAFANAEGGTIFLGVADDGTTPGLSANHADELPTRASVDALDELRFRDFLRDTCDQPLPSRPAERLRLLANMNLATKDGVLNLAGLLLFGERPERIKPQFVIKAVKYPGNDIHTSKYDDTEDFGGPLRNVFDAALAFVLRNLHKIQAGRGVNSPGLPEIPPVVFEELLVNALVHRDYLISAPIRLFVFDNRIEIISPGTLPNNLTVENIRAGNSNLRNPILASFVAKGVLPYRGLDSGVPRALECRRR
jgi:ATP-dependent DNA helicase RecG